MAAHRRALKERRIPGQEASARQESSYAAFLQDAGIGGLGQLRALPWVDMRCPFRAEASPWVLPWVLPWACRGRHNP